MSALSIRSCFRINAGRSHRPNSFFDIVWSEATGKYYWGANTLHYRSTDAPVVRHALRADLHITCAMTVEQDPIDNAIICLRHTYCFRSRDRYAAHECGLRQGLSQLGLPITPPKTSPGIDAQIDRRRSRAASVVNGVNLYSRWRVPRISGTVPTKMAGADSAPSL